MKSREGPLQKHVFVGYHDDMAAIVVLREMNAMASRSEQKDNAVVGCLTN